MTSLVNLNFGTPKAVELNTNCCTLGSGFDAISKVVKTLAATVQRDLLAYATDAYASARPILTFFKD